MKCSLFLWFGLFFHTAVDLVRCTFAGMHMSAAYDAVSFLVAFPVHGLENISDGEDQLERKQCQHSLWGF